jgi:hypothetical protein
MLDAVFAAALAAGVWLALRAKSFVTFIELKCRDFLGMVILNIIKQVISDRLFSPIQASRLCAGEIRPDLFRLPCEGEAKRRGG